TGPDCLERLPVQVLNSSLLKLIVQLVGSAVRLLGEATIRVLNEKILGVVVQLVRMPACHAGGRGFESRPFRRSLGRNFRAFCILKHFFQVWSLSPTRSGLDYVVSMHYRGDARLSTWHTPTILSSCLNAFYRLWGCFWG